MTERGVIASLATEVLLRAFHDLNSPPSACFPDGKRGQVNVYDDAVRFLTASTPAWATSLENWCAFANVDPNVVIERATKLTAPKGVAIV